MRLLSFFVFLAMPVGVLSAGDPPVRIFDSPSAFETLVNPTCSHCRDEAKRRAEELAPGDRILAWTRGYSDGGAIPMRFFLNSYRVISDSYGVFVYDPDAGFARGFAASYDFRFQGWRNGVMTMKHKDGTVYSCLTGFAFDGPKKGSRLEPIPTVTSRWGWWLENYPHAVAYHMFEKYRPIELPAAAHMGSLKSRPEPDARLGADVEVLGIRSEKSARSFPIGAVEKRKLIRDEAGGEAVVVLWEPQTRTAAAYRPRASLEPKRSAPGDPSTTRKPEASPGASRKVTLSPAANDAGRFEDKETGSRWDVTGRCVRGELRGYTLEWVDSVQVKWFAWAAEYPATPLFAPKAE
jgi:hypothetical protein